MSFRIVNGKDIELTRGDSLYLTIELRYKDGTPYEYSDGDSGRFAMKKCIFDTEYEPVIERDLIPNKDDNTWTLYLKPEDTKDLPNCSTYDYDIQLTYKNPVTGNIDVDTFITDARFKITPEVSWNE